MREEEAPYREQPPFEFVEHLRERRDSELDWAPSWYLLGFRLSPLVLLCFLSAAIEKWLSPFSEVVGNVAELGLYLLTFVGGYLIHMRFYVPRYGWHWPANNRTRDQLRSVPKDLLTFAGVIAAPAVGLWADLHFGLSVSFTLAAVGVLLLVWWWLAGTKGRLFYVEDHWRLVTMGLPLRLKVWELVTRHYYLALAVVVFSVSLTPLLGLTNYRLFANVIAFELTVGVVVIVSMLFDELRLRRLRPRGLRGGR